MQYIKRDEDFLFSLPSLIDQQKALPKTFYGSIPLLHESKGGVQCSLFFDLSQELLQQLAQKSWKYTIYEHIPNIKVRKRRQ